MGSTLPTHSSSLTTSSTRHIQISPQNWLLLQKPEVNVTQMGSFAIYKNKVTGEVAREYTINFDRKKDFDIYMEEFDEWRSYSHWNVIESKYIVSDKQPFSLGQLCSSHFQVKLFVENPVVALSQIKDIPPSESFYILLSALVGFEHLFEVFGYFPLRQNMILINEFGIVKVWVNTDLSQNRPIHFNFFNVSAQDMENPTRFIFELIQLIDNNTDYGQMSVSFHEFIHTRCDKKRILTFSNCRKHLLNFAEENRIDIPDSLMSILDLLFEKTNRSELSSQNEAMIDQNVLYGKNYVAEGYLLENEQEEEEAGYTQHNQFNSPQQDPRNPSRNQFVQSFKPYYHHNQQITNQINRIVQGTASQQNPTPSQSSHNLSSQQLSYHTLNDPKHIPNFQSHSQSPPQPYKQRHHYHHHSHGLIYYEPYQQLPQNVSKVPVNVNFTHNVGTNHEDNLYHSLVHREVLERQSTIREEAEEDSFLTSHKNSKFQTSRDLRRASNHMKKAYKNKQTNRHTFSSQSDSKLNIENLSPRQLQLRQDQIQQTNNQQSQQLTKRSQKSIQFHTPSQIKELDQQIAHDLETMMIGQGIRY